MLVGVAGNGNSGCASPVHHEDGLWRPSAQSRMRTKRLGKPNLLNNRTLRRRIRLIWPAKGKPCDLQGFPILGHRTLRRCVHHPCITPLGNGRRCALSLESGVGNKAFDRAKHSQQRSADQRTQKDGCLQINRPHGALGRMSSWASERGLLAGRPLYSPWMIGLAASGLLRRVDGLASAQRSGGDPEHEQ